MFGKFFKFSVDCNKLASASLMKSFRELRRLELPVALLLVEKVSFIDINTFFHHSLGGINRS